MSKKTLSIIHDANNYHCYLGNKYLTESPHWVPPRVIESLGFEFKELPSYPWNDQDHEKFFDTSPINGAFLPPSELFTLLNQIDRFQEHKRKKRIEELEKELARLKGEDIV